MSILHPMQMCFVVDDVAQSVEFAEEVLGWGPFMQFTANVEGEYRDWKGPKTTHVALGMAGDVQMEFLHMDCGQDPVASYQAKYSTGFQHLGVVVESRDEAIEHLTALGASVDQLNEYPGVKFAFVDLPTGPAMFELLQREGGNADISSSTDSKGRQAKLPLDRATIVTADMQATMAFYCAAFEWGEVNVQTQTLRYGDQQCQCQRYLGQAGTMQIEIIAPLQQGGDPYSLHLQRGDHGLVHAGGKSSSPVPDEGLLCEWLETNEQYRLLDWHGGSNALAVRL